MELKLIKEIQAHKDGILSSDIYEDLLITTSEDNSIKIWQLPDFNNIKTIENAHQKDIKKVLFSPTKEFFLTASTDSYIKIWKVKDFSLSKEILAHDGEVNSIAFLNENKYISVSDDETAKIWELGKNSPYKTLKPKIGDINSIDCDNLKIILGGTSLNFYDNKLSLLKQNNDYIYGINKIKITKSNILLSTSMEKTLEIWDHQFNLIKKIKNSTWINDIQYDLNNIFLAKAEYISILNSSYETIYEIEAHKDEIYSLSLYKNFIISLGNDKILKVWEIIK